MGRHNHIHRDARHTRDRKRTLLDQCDVVRRNLPEYSDIRYVVNLERKMIIENTAAPSWVQQAVRVLDEGFFDRLLDAA